MGINSRLRIFDRLSYLRHLAIVRRGVLDRKLDALNDDPLLLVHSSSDVRELAPTEDLRVPLDAVHEQRWGNTFGGCGDLFKEAAQALPDDVRRGQEGAVRKREVVLDIGNTLERDVSDGSSHEHRNRPTS